MIRTGVGQDYIILEDNIRKDDSDQVLAAAYGYSSKGRLAMIRANNNLVLSGAVPDRILVGIVAGKNCPEQTIRDEMNDIVKSARDRGILVLGGNTVFSGEGNGISINVTAFGNTDCNIIKQLTQKISAGCRIFAIGYAGEYGASIIYKYKTEDLGKRFSKSYIKKESFGTGFCEKDMDISPIVRCLIDSKACYIHDITFGGIYRALYEISEAAGLGIDIIHERIPIRQSTIEVCEFYGINPYMLLGTGGVLAVVSPENENVMKSALESSGAVYSMIGELTKESGKIIRSEKYEMNRALTMYEEDEIYKVIPDIEEEQPYSID